MPQTEHRPLEYMRADAARNLQRIVEVAAGLVAADPSVGMAQVAASAGVARATVYRHFPTRDALLEAIFENAVAHGERAMYECRLEEGSARAALARLTRAWLGVGERYSFSQAAVQTDFVVSEAMRERHRRVFRESIQALIRRGQESGEFSASVPVEWAARAFGALLQSGARAVTDGDLDPDVAPEVVLAMLLDGLAGR